MQVYGVELPAAWTALLDRGACSDLVAACGAEAPEAHFARGVANEMLGKFSDADAAFAACAAAYPLACRVERAFLDIVWRGKSEAALAELYSCLLQPTCSGTLGARCRHLIGLAEHRCRRPDKAMEPLLTALEMYETAGSGWGAAQVRDTLGMVEAGRGRIDLAATHYNLSLADKAVRGDKPGLAVTLGNLGRSNLSAGRYAEALQCFERDLALCEEIGDLRGRTKMYNDVGRTLTLLERYDEAEASLTRGAEVSREHRLTMSEFFCRKDLAALRVAQGRFDDVAGELAAARALLSPQPEPYLQWLCDAVEADLLIARDDAAAEAILDRLVVGFRQADVPDQEIAARLGLARVLSRRGARVAAEQCLGAGLRLARQDGFSRFFSPLNEALAELGLSEAADVETDRPLARDDAPPDQKSYVIRKELKPGAYGQVFHVHDRQRGIYLARKQLSVGGLYVGAERSRLIDSARTELVAASRVRHPGVVRVFAVGTDPNGDFYVAQEWVEGRALRDDLRYGRCEPAELVLPTLIKIAHALHELHTHEVIHRDLKPENVLLRRLPGDRNGEPVLVDLGIAQVVDPKRLPWSKHVAGTLEYMAPEQTSSPTVDCRADLYSLGVLAFEWLAGDRPLHLTGANWTECSADLYRQLPAPPITSLRPHTSPQLTQLITRLLSKKARHRPSTAGEVADEFEAILARGE